MAWILLIPLVFSYVLYTLREFTEINLHHYINEICDVINEDGNYIKSSAIVISCKSTANLIYNFNMLDAQFDTLYTRIKDKYIINNNVPKDQVAFVENERQNEFVLFRLVRGQLAVFETLNQRYSLLLNAFYFFFLGLIWLYVLLHGLYNF